MGATPGLIVASHPLCADHVPFPGHPERPARLEAALAGAALEDATPLVPEYDEPAALEALSRVHAPDLPARLREACKRAPAVFDSPDNPISQGTYQAAIAAVAASVAAADALAGGTPLAFAAVRPPGHHAEHDRAMGFCFFNNAAVAAERLLARGIGPIAIVDFDVHHGNGTQRHFWERDDVFYLSVHRHNFYPGTGGADEIGESRGRGFTRNFPLAAGSDGEAILSALAVGLEEVLAAMRPAAWLISAGFDAGAADPLGGMSLTDDDFAAIGGLLGQARGDAPLMSVLEGGYNLDALRRGVRRYLGALTQKTSLDN